MNTLEEELVDSLKPVIDVGKIRIITDDSPFIQVLSRNFPPYFPFEGSMVFGNVDETDKDASLSFFDAFCRDACIPENSFVTVVGDNVLTAAYECQVDTLGMYLLEFTSLPQHTFILTADGRWCLCYRFEGDVGYGHTNSLTNNFPRL